MAPDGQDVIDPGLIVLVIVGGIFAMAIWSWRTKADHKAPLDHTKAQPGRRLDGIDNVGGDGL